MSIQNGAVRYSGKPVFEGLSFNIHENTKIALVGRNGAGKTTLMRI
ncbi:MAG: ATP-binding cassette domain-containing protein, partial [Pseudomonadota bacterium]